jgi:glutamine synthetase
VEHRVPDPAANPYLALAVMLAAGLDGIRTSADYREPVNENIWEMSHREKRRLRIDDLPHGPQRGVRRIGEERRHHGRLGEHISQHFLAAKRQEWREYITQVRSGSSDNYLAKY